MKLKTTHAMALCALTLLASQSVWAITPTKGTWVKVAVEGTISPGACEISLDNKGKFNYESIPAVKIKDVAEGNLIKPNLTTHLAIQCEEDTQIGFNIIDNAHTSVVEGLKLDNAGLSSKDTSYGLGKDKTGNNIGAYVFQLDQGMLGTSSANIGYIKVSDSSMSSKNFDYIWNDMYGRNDKLLTWAETTSSNTPASAKSFAGRLIAISAINKKSALDLSEEIKLQGDATLTVYYL